MDVVGSMLRRCLAVMVGSWRFCRCWVAGGECGDVGVGMGDACKDAWSVGALACILIELRVFESELYVTFLVTKIYISKNYALLFVFLFSHRGLF